MPCKCIDPDQADEGGRWGDPDDAGCRAAERAGVPARDAAAAVHANWCAGPGHLMQERRIDIWRAKNHWLCCPICAYDSLSCRKHADAGSNLAIPSQAGEPLL
jgi:hypothetical protein